VLEVIGRGRHADVYAIDDARVLRRYRDVRGRDTLRQAEAMRIALAAGYPVPRVYDASGADLVMERVRGRSLIADMVRRPWMIASHALTLAELHRRLHLIDAPATFPVPVGAGTQLLHLDLQPENVLWTDTGPVVLDWEWAARGPALADVAHTVLQLDTSEVPGGAARRGLASFGRNLFTRRFVEAAGGREPLQPHAHQVATYRLAARELTDGERARIHARLGP
jgi:aminoglycoside phosphotransferase (APT) family kinase protein